MNSETLKGILAKHQLWLDNKDGGEQANLTDTNLMGANLMGANLTRANLRDADLMGANLTRANLRDADLTQSNLRDANLFRADLRGADLTSIKADFFKVLDANRREIDGLRAALIEGRINGKVYQGKCACLVGTIANLKGVNHNTLSPDSDRPVERWFLAVKQGDTPANSQVSAVTVDWIADFLRE